MSRYDPQAMTQWLSDIQWQSGSISIFDIVEPMFIVSFAGDGVISANIQRLTPNDHIEGYPSAETRYIETSTRRYDSGL